MANRRDVLRAGATLPAASLVAAPFARTFGAPGQSLTLETFALDRGMHVVYRGERGLVENGRITHRFAGPAALIEWLSPLPHAWEGEFASALTECPLGSPQTARAELVTDGAPLSLRDVPLYSWIIAPRAAVSSRVES